MRWNNTLQDGRHHTINCSWRAEVARMELAEEGVKSKVQKWWWLTFCREGKEHWKMSREAERGMQQDM